MSQSNEEKSGVAFILYVDHQGHPAPLTECFHATASRRLSSTVYRYPVATQQEADSGYCPQCLAFHDATSAADLGYCPKATCQRCPVCLSVASVHASLTGDGGETECFYQCGLCEWTSKQCNLTTKVESPAGRLELARAAEDMGTVLSQKRREARKPVEALYKYASESWKNSRKERRQQEKASSRMSRSTVESEWSVETLEAKLLEKTAALQSDSTALPTISGLQIKRISPKDDAPSTTLAVPDTLPLISYQMQMLHAPGAMSSADGILPLPVPLTVRKSRRCRAELSDGRPGILLKPKLNPLEGDSSLPSGHGQWYRKDSSAIHVIPRVSVVRQCHFDDDDKGRKKSFLLKVANPTLGTVRLRLTTSSFRGEADCWSEDDDETMSITQSFTALLVDSLTQTFVDAELKPDLTESLGTSETVELLSAEDSIIEMGGRARATPEQVEQWNADLKDAKTGIRLVAKSASDAWFEVVIVVHDQHDENSKEAAAVPLALQVDLGNGSWESSLVPVEEGKTDDSITFDLVLIWT